MWGGVNYNPASRFLNEIPAELTALSEERTPKGRPDATDPSEFRVGQEVEHTKWGRGTILEIARTGIGGVEATVHFPELGSEKRLDLSLAPLKPVS